VDTTWARLPWRVRLREVFSERLYQPTAPDEFDTIMQHLASVDFSGFTFIDMGSGKGRVLLMAAMYPFHQIMGVEVQPDLHAIAERNIEMFEMPGRQCAAIESVCLDAREFEFPETPLFVYLFNPFPDYVLRNVLENLGRSLTIHPRKAYVAYNAPYEQHAFAGLDWLVRIVQHDRYQIYMARI
jgi:predicted RNA methylase